MRKTLLALLPSLLCAQLPQEPARVQVFQASAGAVRKGATVTLRWAAAGTDQVRLEPPGLDLPARGELSQPVNGPTIFWLHATNAKGGQSIPLVVALLPDDPAFPNLNGIQAPAPAEPPASAPAQPLVLPLPALTELPALTAPAAVAAVPKRRLIRRSGPRPAWIQFAAMVNSRCSRKLQQDLLRVAATRSTLWSKARRSGAPMQFIRSGPYSSAGEAQRRLRELGPMLAALRLQPIIITGPSRVEAQRSFSVAGLRPLPWQVVAQR